MTLRQIACAVRRIAATAGDEELAHKREDHLHRAVLTAIAEGRCADPAACAAAALRTRALVFGRWYS